MLVGELIDTHGITSEEFLEISIESWPVWELNPVPLNLVQTL